MTILTCLRCPVPVHVTTGIGNISLFAIMDAEPDEPRAKRANVQRQLEQNHTYVPGTSKSL